MKKNIYVLFAENWKTILGTVSIITIIAGIGVNYGTGTTQNKHISKRLDTLANNHIYHLQKDVTTIKGKLVGIETSQYKTEKDVDFIKNCLIRDILDEKDF